MSIWSALSYFSLILIYWEGKVFICFGIFRRIRFILIRIRVQFWIPSDLNSSNRANSNFFLIFVCKRYKTRVVFCIFFCNKWILLLNILLFWLNCMRVYHDYFLLPESRSTFPEVDSDPDPAKWYGSNQIRIRNTGCNPWNDVLVYESNKSNYVYSILLPIYLSIFHQDLKGSV